MQPSQNILRYIKSTERCILKAYLPTPQDRPTIGYGSTGPDIHLGMVWTQEQAEQRFQQTISVLAAQITRALGNTPTTQNQFDAMFSLAYNIGIGNFMKSSVLRDHRARNTKRVPQDFMSWTRQAGRVLKGLVTRRQKEAQIYETV